jgi:uncharacterized membrane protein YvlD (DUF360 family)
MKELALIVLNAIIFYLVSPCINAPTETQAIINCVIATGLQSIINMVIIEGYTKLMQPKSVNA